MLCYFQVYSRVNQLHIYIYHPYSFFFQILFHIGYYRILSSVPCAIQQVFINYLFYIQQCIYVNLSLLIYPSSLFPGNHEFVFYVCDSTSVLQISSLVPFFKIFHIKTSCDIHLTHFTQHDSLQTHSRCCRWHLFFFMAEEYSIVCVCNTSSLSVLLLMDIFQIASMSWLL